MSLTFASGRFACIQSSWLDPRKVRDMTIVGTKKMIVYDDIEPLQKIRIYDQRVETPPHYETFGEFQYAYHYGDVLAPYIRQEEPLKVECQHFLDCIRGGSAPLTDGTQGLKMIRILEAASQSLKNSGERVSLPG
jgi:predicted dehydrogenase